jgi:hypothetical protein
LLTEARRGNPFQVGSGLPASLQPVQEARTWIQHAEEYVRMKWPTASPRHRRGIAEALTDATTALLPHAAGRPQ